MMHVRNRKRRKPVAGNVALRADRAPRAAFYSRGTHHTAAARAREYKARHLLRATLAHTASMQLNSDAFDSYVHVGY